MGRGGYQATYRYGYIDLVDASVNGGRVVVEMKNVWNCLSRGILRQATGVIPGPPKGSPLAARALSVRGQAGHPKRP